MISEGDNIVSISKGQKKQLETCAKWANADDVVLHVIIAEWIHTRESGSGYPIAVKMWYTSEPQGYDLSASLSRCTERYTAFDKAKEIANYLVDCGVPKDKVTIKSKIGQE